jgi:hypothetical protein
MSAKPEPFWIACMAAGSAPRLRNPGESVEDYRIAMGWDKPSEATMSAILYEHEDGRHAIAPTAEAATFTAGDPKWHRVGPVDTGCMPSPAAQDANNYCRILTLLGMEEEGDPVAEVASLVEASRMTADHLALAKFYGVTTYAGLVQAQAHHVEKLQAKLPPTPSLAPQRVREG